MMTFERRVSRDKWREGSISYLGGVERYQRYRVALTERTKRQTRVREMFAASLKDARVIVREWVTK